MTPQPKKSGVMDLNVLTFLLAGAAIIFTVPARSFAGPVPVGKSTQAGSKAPLNTKKEAVHLDPLESFKDQSTASLLFEPPTMNEPNAFGLTFGVDGLVKRDRANAEGDPLVSDAVATKTGAGTVTKQFTGETAEKRGDISGMLAFYMLFFGGDNSAGSFSRSSPVNSVNDGRYLGLGVIVPPPIPPIPPVLPPPPSPVPEPATLALFGVGLLGLSRLRRSHRKEETK